MGAHRVATVSPSAVTATTAPSNMVTATSSVTVSDSTSRSRFASSQVLVTVADGSATQSARATAAQSGDRSTSARLSLLCDLAHWAVRGTTDVTCTA